MSEPVPLIIDRPILDRDRAAANAIAEDKINELQKHIGRYPGTIPLFLEVRTNGTGIGFIMRSKKYHVLLSDDFLQGLYALLGKNNVIIQG